MNVEIGTETAQFPRKGLHKWDFRCSVSRHLPLLAPLGSPCTSELGLPRSCATQNGKMAADESPGRPDAWMSQQFDTEIKGHSLVPDGTGVRSVMPKWRKC